MIKRSLSFLTLLVCCCIYGWAVVIGGAGNGQIHSPEPNVSAGAGPGFEAQKYYTIHRNGNKQAYIYQQGDGMQTGALVSDKMCYWVLEPTGYADRYYVKNATTGDYIQSSNIGLSGMVKMGKTPVEYEVARGQAGSTAGYYYLCSTDQSISTATDKTLGLNFGVTGVVAYYIKAGRGNSYWEIEESEYNYEVKYFAAVECVDDAEIAIKYRMKVDDGLVVSCEDEGLALAERQAQPTQAWYFVGTSNEREGYVIASYGRPGYTLNISADGAGFEVSKVDTPTRWYVSAETTANGTYLSFVPYDRKEEFAGALTVNGKNCFMLTNFRTTYSLRSQIYYLPCGTRDGAYLTEVRIDGEHVLREMRYVAMAAPSSYYTLFTNDKATVARGKTFLLHIGCSQDEEEAQLFLYFDWNGDGEFEVMTDGTSLKESVEIAVPETAKLGKTRMRVRKTINGLKDAEDDVQGYTYDFVMNVDDPVAERKVTVVSCASDRGTAFIRSEAGKVQELLTTYGTSVTVEAESTGTSVFNGWMRGKTMVSTDAVYTFTVGEQVNLVASFSPNTDSYTDIADGALVQAGWTYRWMCEKGKVGVVTKSKVKSMTVYSVDGEMVVGSNTWQVDMRGLPPATYIIKVKTVDGEFGGKLIMQ